MNPIDPNKRKAAVAIIVWLVAGMLLALVLVCLIERPKFTYQPHRGLFIYSWRGGYHGFAFQYCYGVRVDLTKTNLVFEHIHRFPFPKWIDHPWHRFDGTNQTVLPD